MPLARCAVHAGSSCARRDAARQKRRTAIIAASSLCVPLCRTFFLWASATLGSFSLCLASRGRPCMVARVALDQMRTQISSRIGRVVFPVLLNIRRDALLARNDRADVCAVVCKRDRLVAQSLQQLGSSVGALLPAMHRHRESRSRCVPLKGACPIPPCRHTSTPADYSFTDQLSTYTRYARLLFTTAPLLPPPRTRTPASRISTQSQPASMVVADRRDEQHEDIKMAPLEGARAPHGGKEGQQVLGTLRCLLRRASA